MRYILLFYIGLIAGGLTTYYIIKDCDNTPIDLPEEYQLITKDTPIKGHFEGKTLVIEFNHHYK